MKSVFQLVVLVFSLISNVAYGSCRDAMSSGASGSSNDPFQMLAGIEAPKPVTNPWEAASPETRQDVETLIEVVLREQAQFNPKLMQRIVAAQLQLIGGAVVELVSIHPNLKTNTPGQMPTSHVEAFTKLRAFVLGLSREHFELLPAEIQSGFRGLRGETQAVAPVVVAPLPTPVTAPVEAVVKVNKAATKKRAAREYQFKFPEPKRERDPSVSEEAFQRVEKEIEDGVETYGARALRHLGVSLAAKSRRQDSYHVGERQRRQKSGEVEIRAAVKSLAQEFTKIRALLSTLRRVEHASGGKHPTPSAHDSVLVMILIESHNLTWQGQSLYEFIRTNGYESKPVEFLIELNNLWEYEIFRKASARHDGVARELERERFERKGGYGILRSVEQIQEIKDAESVTTDGVNYLDLVKTMLTEYRDLLEPPAAKAPKKEKVAEVIKPEITSHEKRLAEILSNAETISMAQEVDRFLGLVLRNPRSSEIPYLLEWVKDYLRKELGPDLYERVGLGAVESDVQTVRGLKDGLFELMLSDLVVGGWTPTEKAQIDAALKAKYAEQGFALEAAFWHFVQTNAENLFELRTPTVSEVRAHLKRILFSPGESPQKTLLLRVMLQKGWSITSLRDVIEAEPVESILERSDWGQLNQAVGAEVRPEPAVKPQPAHPPVQSQSGRTRVGDMNPRDLLAILKEDFDVFNTGKRGTRAGSVVLMRTTGDGRNLTSRTMVPGASIVHANDIRPVLNSLGIEETAFVRAAHARGLLR